MENYLTAVTLINDKHIRKFISMCKESDFIYLRSLILRKVCICRDKKNDLKFLLDKLFLFYRKSFSW